MEPLAIIPVPYVEDMLTPILMARNPADFSSAGLYPLTIIRGEIAKPPATFIL